MGCLPNRVPRRIAQAIVLDLAKIGARPQKHDKVTPIDSTGCRHHVLRDSQAFQNRVRQA